MIYGWSSGVWTGDIIIWMAMAIALDMRNGFVGIGNRWAIRLIARRISSFLFGPSSLIVDTSMSQAERDQLEVGATRQGSESFRTMISPVVRGWSKLSKRDSSGGA